MDMLIAESRLTAFQDSANMHPHRRTSRTDAMTDIKDGLDNVVAATTRLSHVDGDAGRLTIAGYAVDDLAPNATFEDVAFLLLNGRLPDRRELAPFARDLAARRTLPRVANDVLRDAAAALAPVMDALRMATPLLSLGRAENPLDDAL